MKIIINQDDNQVVAHYDHPYAPSGYSFEDVKLLVDTLLDKIGDRSAKVYVKQISINECRVHEDFMKVFVDWDRNERGEIEGANDCWNAMDYIHVERR